MEICLKKNMRNKEVPDIDTMNELLDKCKVIIKDIDGEGQTFQTIKKKLNDFTKNKVPLSDREHFKKDEWEKKEYEEKLHLQTALTFIYHQLRDCNTKALCLGATLFVLILILFIGSFGGYLYLHDKLSPNETPSVKEKIYTKDLIALQKEVNMVYALVRQSDGNNEKIKTGLSNIESHLSEEPLSSKSTFGLKKSFSILAAENETGSVKIESLKNFSELLDAEIEAINTTFFWRTTPLKWCEIGFWAYCGVLVGILFYVAGLLESGIFPSEIIPMILTEIIITPPVVLIIFFLFPITGLANIIPSESSIHMSIGIAFILGFAIRRTVGLLDTIKRRILPDPPLPTGKKVEG